MTDGGLRAGSAGSSKFDAARSAIALGPALRHPVLREASTRAEEGRLNDAARLAREFLKHHPNDARALHLLADIAKQRGRKEEQLLFLARCVQSAPDFAPSTYAYVEALLELDRPNEALEESGKLILLQPENPLVRAQRAAIFESLSDYDEAASIWREILRDYPTQVWLWERYGTALRMMGSTGDAIDAYRKMLEIDPASAGGWWRLADVKTFRFTQSDIDGIEAQLRREGMAAKDRAQLHFALGKACADHELYERSIAEYTKGNALLRVNIHHDPGALSAYIAKCKSLFTPQFFRERNAFGSGSSGPIFLLGMPRAGSTLIEQILASHSQIEGTKELRELALISQTIQKEAAERGLGYPEILSELEMVRSRQLGELYLESARRQRKLGRPFFIDKMGANLVHVGLIELILPHARFIDVRRHPLACCFSCFAQIFPEGQNNAYRLDDLGRYYRDYVELMAHFDHALPGRVHRVFYENLIAEPETEVRRLLDHLHLPFEEQCLRFHQTVRAVSTVSAEQVRTPLYRHALEHWKHYEPWLGPLKAALGPVLDSYPEAPRFY